MTRAMQVRRPGVTATVAAEMAERVTALDWAEIAAALGAHGAATMAALLSRRTNATRWRPATATMRGSAAA